MASTGKRTLSYLSLVTTTPLPYLQTLICFFHLASPALPGGASIICSRAVPAFPDGCLCLHYAVA
ncbi:hypothetical protein E2C01_029926 [Portunus trituberculatus]|uniref:Uncharacterized protein n=1 Tax=Portunus trituberculatus TaxID=210409 RepID=A0A5B7ETC3_PORTR|nr:hypothetical protein [Portunus trituberculatus]